MALDDERPPGQDTFDALALRLAELERENAALRAQVSLAPAAAGAGSSTPRVSGGGRRRWGRATAAVVLVTLGVLLAPVAVAAHWAQRELTDTDRYLATVGPLAGDPVVQSALENRITSAVIERIDVPGIVDDVSGGLEDQGLTRVADAFGLLEGPLTSGVESVVQRAATSVVESDAFETVWLETNRATHEQLVAVMQGDEGNILLLSDDGTLNLQLSGVIARVKEEMAGKGLGLAARIPEISATFTLVQAAQLVKVRNAYGLVVTLGTWLPWLSLGLLTAGVLAATRRSRTAVVAGLALTGSMLLLGLGLTIARSLYLDALTGTVERLDAAQVVFDQIVAFIRLSARTVGVLGLVVALTAFLLGSSDSARALRSGTGRALAAARRWGARRGVSAGPVGRWLFRYRRPVRIAIIALGAVVILLAATPTPALIAWIFVIAALLIGLVELLAGPPGPDTGESVPVEVGAGEGPGREGPGREGRAEMIEVAAADVEEPHGPPA